jgi:hypothetical protein
MQWCALEEEEVVRRSSLMKCGRCRWAQQRHARGARPDGEHGGGGGEEHQLDEGSEATGARVIR